VSQSCATLSLVRLALRVSLTGLVLAALVAPAAHAAAPTATTTAPAITPQPQPQPSGSAFSQLQGLAGQDTTPTQTTVTTKRPDTTGISRGMIFLLTGIAFLLIGGVGAVIYYEGRKSGSRRKRRQRLRSGRTPQPATAGAQARRGPPPPPRKRRAQAKRKKR
jgi:hypothetical protein